MAVVGLDLDDPACPLPPHQHLVEQPRGDNLGSGGQLLALHPLTLAHHGGRRHTWVATAVDTTTDGRLVTSAMR